MARVQIPAGTFPYIYLLVYCTHGCVATTVLPAVNTMDGGTTTVLPDEVYDVAVNTSVSPLPLSRTTNRIKIMLRSKYTTSKGSGKTPRFKRKTVRVKNQTRAGLEPRHVRPKS